MNTTHLNIWKRQSWSDNWGFSGVSHRALRLWNIWSVHIILYLMPYNAWKRASDKSNSNYLALHRVLTKRWPPSRQRLIGTDWMFLVFLIVSIRHHIMGKRTPWTQKSLKLFWSLTWYRGRASNFNGRNCNIIKMRTRTGMDAENMYVGSLVDVETRRHTSWMKIEHFTSTHAYWVQWNRPICWTGWRGLGWRQNYQSEKVHQ